MTPQTILVIPATGDDPIEMRVIAELESLPVQYLLDDGESRWTVRSTDVQDGRVAARNVYLVPNQY